MFPAAEPFVELVSKTITFWRNEMVQMHNQTVLGGCVPAGWPETPFPPLDNAKSGQQPLHLGVLWAGHLFISVFQLGEQFLLGNGFSKVQHLKESVQ